MSSERGNVLWFILLSVVLLGAITMVLSRSGNTVDQTGDVEQMRIKAGQIIRYGKSIEAAIQDMRLRGISENDISFENTVTATNYTNANCTNADCKVFDVAGAGIAYQDPPTGFNDGSEWLFTGANNIGTTAGPVGTTAARSGNDILMLMPGANIALCKQINRDFNISASGTIPTDGTGVVTDAFTGTFAAALTVIAGDSLELNDHNAGCFTDTDPNPDVTYFYYVILSR